MLPMATIFSDWQRRALVVLAAAVSLPFAAMGQVQLTGQLGVDRSELALISHREIVSLFNGTNLDGWMVRGGKASYEAKDGEIIGTVTVKGGGNTFLCTEKEYADFILELEIKADQELNSGVQIRSQCFDSETTYDFGNQTIKIPAQRVHGYQVEVDNRPERRWSGGIYDESRRGWLFSLPTNSPAGRAFKFGDWNKYRIQCLGSSIKTWVNDVPAADLVDAESLRGFIGLQVHSTDKPGLQVRFRNIRLRDLGRHYWMTAWDCRSFDGMEQRGPATWELMDGVLRVTQTGAASTNSALLGTTPLQDAVVRFKYKTIKTGFSLNFLPELEGKDQSGFSFSFLEPGGPTTNLVRAKDWNTVVAMVQRTRTTVFINGRQLSDAPIPPRSGVFPALRLPVGSAAEVYFKDFEILNCPE